jgi:hypothetical protein
MDGSGEAAGADRRLRLTDWVSKSKYPKKRELLLLCHAISSNFNIKKKYYQKALKNQFTVSFSTLNWTYPSCNLSPQKRAPCLTYSFTPKMAQVWTSHRPFTSDSIISCK